VSLIRSQPNIIDAVRLGSWDCDVGYLRSGVELYAFGLVASSQNVRWHHARSQKKIYRVV